jgi:hypothetical protein
MWVLPSESITGSPYWKELEMGVKLKMFPFLSSTCEGKMFAITAAFAAGPVPVGPVFDPDDGASAAFAGKLYVVPFTSVTVKAGAASSQSTG